MRSFTLSVAGALAGVFLANVAWADERPDAIRAAALFEEGRRLMAAEDYAAACPKLAESQALAPAADTALDLGICYQKASQAAFKAAHEMARSPEPSAIASPSSRPVGGEAEGSAEGQTQRTVGLAIGGGGVAGIVAGVVLGVMAKSKYDDSTKMCTSNICATASAIDERNSAIGLAQASTVALLAGAAAVGGGAIVYFTAPKSKSGSGASVGVGPAAQGAGLAFAGRF